MKCVLTYNTPICVQCKIMISGKAFMVAADCKCAVKQRIFTAHSQRSRHLVLLGVQHFGVFILENIGSLLEFSILQEFTVFGKILKKWENERHPLESFWQSQYKYMSMKQSVHQLRPCKMQCTVCIVPVGGPEQAFLHKFYNFLCPRLKIKYMNNGAGEGYISLAQ